MPNVRAIACGGSVRSLERFTGCPVVEGDGTADLHGLCDVENGNDDVASRQAAGGEPMFCVDFA